MRNHIDWLTFTGNPVYTAGDDLPRAILNGVYTLLGGKLMDALLTGEGKQRERSRAPYTYAWEWKKGSVVIFASPTLSHFTVEISGQGCESLIRSGAMEKVIAAVADRVTRIDIASDIETGVKPQEFVEKTKHKRMRASGYQKSETGETCYVGSQKSDRYARVYRYNAPHPRNHLLRIEHVFRREAAKLVSRAVRDKGTSVVAASAGDVFGWDHPTWQLGGDVGIDLSPVKAERNGGKTVTWLLTAVAPAFKRLVADGTIQNPQEFLSAYFLEQ